LRESLLDLGLRVNIDEIHLVFDRFNKLDDGELRYSEFSDAFMPQDLQVARLLGTKKLSYLSRPGKCPFLI
jgi:hypothetical protein